MTSELTIASAEETIRQALAQFSTLCGKGLNHGDNESGSFEDAVHAHAIVPAHVLVAFNWLKVQPRTTDVDRRGGSSSYVLRHECRNDTGQYVTNGAFIVASLVAGFEIRPCSPTSPDVYLNISQRRIHPPAGACLCTNPEPPEKICDNCRHCRSSHFLEDQALWDRLWWQRETARALSMYESWGSPPHIIFDEYMPLPRRLPASRNH